MLKAKCEQAKETGSLVLEGELIIDHAEELKGILQSALSNGSTLDLNLAGVSKVDLFGLQVLCSAHHSAMKANKAMTLTGERPEALRDAIVLAGYGSTIACSLDKTCPWNEK